MKFARFIGWLDIVMAAVLMPVAMVSGELAWVHVFGLAALVAFLVILASHRFEDLDEQNVERSIRSEPAPNLRDQD